MSSADERDDVSLKYVNSIINEKGITDVTKEKIFGKEFLEKYNKTKTKINNPRQYKDFKKEANNFLNTKNDYEIKSFILTSKTSIDKFKRIPGIYNRLKYLLSDLKDNSKDIVNYTNINKDIGKYIIHIISSKFNNNVFHLIALTENKEGKLIIKYDKNGNEIHIAKQEKDLLDKILARKRLDNYNYKKQEEEKENQKEKEYKEYKNGIKFFGKMNNKEKTLKSTFVFDELRELNIEKKKYKVEKISFETDDMFSDNEIGRRTIDLQILSPTNDNSYITIQTKERELKKDNSEIWNQLIHFKQYKQMLKDTYVEHNPIRITDQTHADRSKILKHILEDIAEEIFGRSKNQKDILLT
jgi:hypothetical protein